MSYTDRQCSLTVFDIIYPVFRPSFSLYKTCTCHLSQDHTCPCFTKTYMLCYIRGLRSAMLRDICHYPDFVLYSLLCLLFSIVFFDRFFPIVSLYSFGSQLRVKDVRAASPNRSSITGSFQSCSSHTRKISGTPLPARSPIFIRLNIFISALFLGSDSPPLRI